MIETDGKFYSSSTILDKAQLSDKVKELKAAGKKIGIGTGSFDLLHPGHIAHLRSAKKFCDVFIIIIASDEYNQRSRKSAGRPIFTEQVRAFAVSQLDSVDYVIVDDDIIGLIEMIKPDVYVKGKDYTEFHDPVLKEQERVLNSFGGVLKFTEDEKLSTTDIIKYVKEEIN